MERIDIGARAWVDRIPAWLDDEAANSAFQVLMDEIPWEERAIVVKDKEVMQPRLVSWCSEMSYKYSGQILEPRQTHPLVEAMRLRLVEAYDIPFNHVVLNLYRDGQDRVAMHADNEPERGKNPVVCSLSLGARRKLETQSKRRKRHRKNFPLLHGEMLVFGGTFQHRFRHGVPRKANAEPRINVTFRYLRGEPGWRGDDNRRAHQEATAGVESADAE